MLLERSFSCERNDGNKGKRDGTANLDGKSLQWDMVRCGETVNQEKSGVYPWFCFPDILDHLPIFLK